MNRYKNSFLVLIAFIIGFCQVVVAQSSKSAEPLLPVEVHNKWGYINQAGKMVIKPQYDEAANFSDGWAKVKIRGKVSFIDASGKAVLTPDVSSVKSFSEGLAAASKAGSKKWGYINKKGAFVIKPRFLLAYDFSESKAAVKVKKKAGFGYINKQGKMVIKPQFDGARKFVDGLAPAQTGGFVFGRWGYINTSGSFVIKHQYEDALPFSEGLAAVDTKKSGSAKEATWGYIDRKGNMVIKPHFEYGRAFSGGFAPVKDPSGWKFVDTKGEYVFRRLGNKLIDFADPFRGNLARVTTRYYMARGSRGGTVTYDGTAKKWAYVDKSGKKVWPKPETTASSKSQTVVQSTSVKAPSGFTLFKAQWPGCYLTTVYPNGWTATDLYKQTGFIKSVVFVKNSQASKELFSSKKAVIDNSKKIRMVTDDNIIIMVGVLPGGGSDLTPKQVIASIKGSGLKNEQKSPVKTHTYHHVFVAVRKIKGVDEDGKKVGSFQLVAKRWGRMVTVFGYFHTKQTLQTTRRVASAMLDNMKVVDRK